MLRFLQYLIIYEWMEWTTNSVRTLRGPNGIWMINDFYSFSIHWFPHWGLNVMVDGRMVILNLGRRFA